jgi:hypothetical protein
MKSLALSLALVIGQTPPPKAVTAPAHSPVIVSPLVAPPVVTTPSSVPVTPSVPTATISGPATIQEHTLTSFTVPGFDQVAWLVIPAISTDTNGGKLDITGAPGSYTIMAAVVQAGQPVILSQILTVQATPLPSGAAPTPQTPATANTGPAAKVPGVWAFGIFDPTTLTQIAPGQLAVHNSKTIHASLEGMGVHYREVDSTQLGAPWVAAMKGVALPALAAVDSTGKFVLAPEPMPADETAVVAELKAVSK